MFDPELGAHLHEPLPSSIALSSSAVAAPGFVTAAIDGDTGEQLELGGKVLTASPADHVLGELSGRTDLVPIAGVRADRTVDVLPANASERDGLIVLRIEDPSVAAQRPQPTPPPAPRWVGTGRSPERVARRCSIDLRNCRNRSVRDLPRLSGAWSGSH